MSQYIKEKGSLADLGLGLPTRVLDSAPLDISRSRKKLCGKPDAYRPPTTMSLLPGVVGVADDETKDKKSMELSPQSIDFRPAKAETKEQEKSQLTIFYGGKVLVFDNFPAEKANDLMQLASKGQNFSSGTTSLVASDLPIARKTSLHRFLEKRKDRINAMSPYQPIKSSGSKDVTTVKEEEIRQPWLGLGSPESNPGLSSDCSR
ncbi:Protein TIFY 10A [Dendrobium catenatum]|uniref:Protein TIFY n=1 Tax=Dendrobium catenatum TaxID=906689 RepID=A0A2I0XAI9_9ASPA|nr:Protein TIFY 10A [Dendrobium catenatum]